MKKLIIKDRKLRVQLKDQEKQCFVLKAIFQNSNLFILTRWNAYLQLKDLSEKSSKVSISPRCVYTMNKKRFSILAPFSNNRFQVLVPYRRN